MAYITEDTTWQDGIYRIETTDPVSGGESGIDNLPHKQLAARTKYLKTITDEVVAARGTYSNLGARLDLLQPLAFDTTNSILAVAMQALSEAGLANREILKLQKQRIQSGQITIKNRGVISGCAISKSSSATRNLDIAAGAIFIGGRIFPVVAQTGAASVPSNSGSASATCYAYIAIDSNGMPQLITTSFGESVPSNGLTLYRITVPAGNTDQTDPYLTNVTLTDLRRMEPNYPNWFASASYAAVALPYPMLDANYLISLDVVSIQGAGALAGGDLFISSRSVNGFNINYNGIGDSIVVNWRTYSPNL